MRRDLQRRPKMSAPVAAALDRFEQSIQRSKARSLESEAALRESKAIRSKEVLDRAHKLLAELSTDAQLAADDSKPVDVHEASHTSNGSKPDSIHYQTREYRHSQHASVREHNPN